MSTVQDSPMEQHEQTINASYRFHSRIKGEVELQIFNDFYLSVTQRQLKRTRQFKIELATLNPKAVKHEELAIHWLVAALLSAIGGGYCIYSMFSGEGIPMLLLGTLLAATLSALFSSLYFYHTERKWTLETRNALYPLISVPYHSSQQKEAQKFIHSLQQAINENVHNKHYSDEDLFAGELRMLRRLSENKILSDALYNQAKAYMMRTHGNTA